MIDWMRGFNLEEANRRAGRHVEFAGFDMQTPDVAARIARDYIARHDRGFLPRIEAAVAAFDANGKPSFVGNSFPVERMRGHHIVFSGWIKTENVTSGWAGLFWSAYAGGPMPLAFDNMAARGPRGTTPWQRYEIAVDIAGCLQRFRHNTSDH